MTDAEDPRARFRHLPDDPIRPDQLVETSDVNRPVQIEKPLETEWRLAMLGPGTP
jgi:hypothetical protein